MKNTTTYTGPGLPALLGVLFVALKLTGAIAWPWLWVLAPFWIPLALVAVVGVIVALVFSLK